MGVSAAQCSGVAVRISHPVAEYIRNQAAQAEAVIKYTKYIYLFIYL